MTSLIIIKEVIIIIIMCVDMRIYNIILVERFYALTITTVLGVTSTPSDWIMWTAPPVTTW